MEVVKPDAELTQNGTKEVVRWHAEAPAVEFRQRDRLGGGGPRGELPRRRAPSGVGREKPLSSRSLILSPDMTDFLQADIIAKTSASDERL